MAAPAKGPCRSESPVRRLVMLGLLGLGAALCPSSAGAEDPLPPSPDQLAPEIADAYRRFRAIEGPGFFAVSVDGSAFAAVICKPDEACADTKRTLVLTRCLLEGRGPCAMLKDRSPSGITDRSSAGLAASEQVTASATPQEPLPATRPPAPQPGPPDEAAAQPVLPPTPDPEPVPLPEPSPPTASNDGPASIAGSSPTPTSRPSRRSRPDRMAAPADARSIGALPGQHAFDMPVPSAAAALDSFNRADTPGFFALSPDGRYYGYANCPLQGQCEPSRLAIEAVNACLARGGLRCALYAIRRPADIQADRMAAARQESGRPAVATAQSVRDLPPGPESGVAPGKALAPITDEPDPGQAEAPIDGPAVRGGAPPEDDRASQDDQASQNDRASRTADRTAPGNRTPGNQTGAESGPDEATGPGVTTGPENAVPAAGRGMLSSVDLSKSDLPALPDGAPDRVQAAYARFATQSDAGLFALSTDGLGFGTAACGPAQTCGDGKELRALTACLLDSGSPCEIFARKGATPAPPDPEQPPSPGGLAAISDTAATGQGSVTLNLPPVAKPLAVDRHETVPQVAAAETERSEPAPNETQPATDGPADAKLDAGPQPSDAVPGRPPEPEPDAANETAPAPPGDPQGSSIDDPNTGPTARVAVAPKTATPSEGATEALRQFEAAGTPGAFALSADGTVHGRAACPSTGCDGSEAAVAVNACLAAGGNGCRVVDRVGPALATVATGPSQSATGQTPRQSQGARAQAAPVDSAVASAIPPPVPEAAPPPAGDPAVRPAGSPGREPARVRPETVAVPDDRPGRGLQTPTTTDVATLLGDGTARPSASAIDPAERPQRPPLPEGNATGGASNGETSGSADTGPAGDTTSTNARPNALPNAQAAAPATAVPTEAAAQTKAVSGPSPTDDSAPGRPPQALPDDRPGRGPQTPTATDVATLLPDATSRPSAARIDPADRPRQSPLPAAHPTIAGDAEAADAPPTGPVEATVAEEPTPAGPATAAPGRSATAPRPDPSESGAAAAPSQLAAVPEEGPSLSPTDRPDQLSPSVAVALQTFHAQPEAGFFAVSDDGLRSAAVYCQAGEPCDYTQSLVAIDACLDRGARNCTIYTAKGRKIAAGPPPAAPPAASPGHAERVAHARQAPGPVEAQVAAVASPSPSPPPESESRGPDAPARQAARPAMPDVEEFGSQSTATAARAAALIDLPPPPPLPPGPGPAPGPDTPSSDSSDRSETPPGNPTIAALPPATSSGPITPAPITTAPGTTAPGTPAPQTAAPRMTAPDAARIDIDTLSDRTVSALEDFMAGRNGGFFAVSANGQVFGETGCPGGAPCGAVQSAAAIQACLAAGGQGCTIFASRQPRPASPVASAPRRAAMAARRDSRPASPSLDQIDGAALNDAPVDAAGGNDDRRPVAQPGQLERPVPPAFAQVQRRPGAGPDGTRPDGVRANGTDGPLLSSNPAVVPVDPSLLKAPAGTAAETPLQQAALPPQAETPARQPLLRSDQRFVQVRWEGIAEDLVGVLSLDPGATAGAGTIALTLPGGRGECRGRLDPGSGQGGWQTGRWRLDCALGLAADGRYLTYLEGPVTTGTGLDGDGRRLSFQVRQNRE